MIGRTWRIWWIKLLHWEFWPFGIVQLPAFLYWLWLSFRARSFFFFSASNPSILSGGMLGESKYDALLLVPERVRPRMLLITPPASPSEVDELIQQHGLRYPLIFKPDIGERGWMVRRINGPNDIAAYLSLIRIPFIVQDFVDLPNEFGVFYTRYPQESDGLVTSITGKKMLSVVGNGKLSLGSLISMNPRALLQWEKLTATYAHQWDDIIEDSREIELVSIGNHCLGTTFLNANHLITEKMNQSFTTICEEIPGFYFGRFDLRCASESALEQGDVMILELNGCGAEPAHIYHPGASFFQGVRTILLHWKTLYKISEQNHRKGVPYMTFSEARSAYRRFASRK
ncbi:MAG: hypothetical protein U0V64_03875 [Cyclobacteriaceae bacterium]